MLIRKSLPSVDDYLQMEKLMLQKILETKSEVKTDNAGIAKFDNLALGFYVVVENKQQHRIRLYNTS